MTVVVPLPEAECRTCGAVIFWATFSGSGRRAPIDMEPRADGNLRIIGRGTRGEPLVDVVRKADAQLFSDEVRYVNHWATCTAPPPRKRR